MNQQGYRTAIVEFIRANAIPPDKFSHQARLYKLATELAEDNNYDDDVLFAAAWMHDLGVFIGHRPEESVELATWDHIAYAAKMVPGILVNCGFPVEKIPAVIEAIRTHLPSSAPVTFEGILLRDADILEQLGAVAILRTVSKVGRDTRFVRLSDALGVLKKNAQELPTKLKLESARRKAKARFELLTGFLNAAESESQRIDW
jgi:uncharacterized protein